MNPAGKGHGFRDKGKEAGGDDDELDPVAYDTAISVVETSTEMEPTSPHVK